MRPRSRGNAGRPRWSPLSGSTWKTQAALEAAASARGIGSSTLMRQIIEEWVAAHRDSPAPNQLGELVRHLDAARRAAASLTRNDAA